MSRPASSTARPPQPFLVALAAWALPGLGYGIIGDWKRGITTGAVIVLLFVSGLLIGGVRVLEVPYFDSSGNRLTPVKDAEGRIIRDVRLLDEVRAKPWSIAQVMTGPVGLIGAYGSTWAARPEDPTISAEPRGVESHARVNEIGVLYTAVAGMLNLLCMIDSAHRAGRKLEGAP